MYKRQHYDDLVKKYAQEIGWDWRMLASLAYTESNFDTTAVSWAGAKGLMQLMPATARAMGVTAGKEQNPEDSIKAVSYTHLDVYKRQVHYVRLQLGHCHRV